jgi:subtilisin family serine protease
LIFLSIGTSSKATQVSQPRYSPEEYVPNEVIFKFKEDAVGDIVQNRRLIENVLSSAHGRIKTYLNQEIGLLDWDPAIFSHRSFIGDPYLFHIRLPEYIGVDEAISFFKSIPYVKYAEKNYIRHVQSTFPNAPDLSVWDETRGVMRQWALYNLAHNRCDIHAPEAWDIFTGSSDIVVGVIDSGIDLDHEDLAANLWTNPNDAPGGGDNDQNGFEDDVNGWDFAEGDNVPEGNSDHGTRMSGIIGAVGNNGLHMSGVCWNVKIMPLRCGGSGVNTALSINAIDYAIKNGVNIPAASRGALRAQLQSKLRRPLL